MKNKLWVLLVPLLLLSGCGGHSEATESQNAAESYSFRDGRYVLPESSADPVPYLLIHDGRYTVVKDVAISYQPGGTIQRNGNEITFEGKYLNEDYRYAFTLIANDELRFELGQSRIPQSQFEWTDGMVFSITEDSASVGNSDLNEEQTALMERYPEYFGLDPAKGLDVIVWQMAGESYSFGLLEHSETPRDRISRELMDLKGVSAEQMREILSTYAVSEEGVYIIPWQNPISSYLPAYCINIGGEDMSAKKEAYIAETRGMLFG
mgnify:CR=1 FL=1